ncbi:MAG: NAD-glutamate dehydrogenase, partial [bacterium]
MDSTGGRAKNNLLWLRDHMHPYFFITMKDEPGAVAALAAGLQFLSDNRNLILADREKMHILATLNLPGSLYRTLRTFRERDLSYAEIIHSYGIPEGLPRDIEIHRYEFDRKEHASIAGAGRVSVPEHIRNAVEAVLVEHYPHFDLDLLDPYLRILWLNNRSYVRISPARRVAQALSLFFQGNRHGGVYLDVEEIREPDMTGAYRVLFAAGNPPEKDFLLQIMEAFYRLNIGISRTYCLFISNGVIPYFLGTFYARARDTGTVTRGTRLFEDLRRELYNTQVLSTDSTPYLNFVREGVMTGEDASLVNAFASFCHTNLAHVHPEIYELQAVQRAFEAHPDMTMQLVSLFRARFDPDNPDREELYARTLSRTAAAIEEYNTGHRFLDDFRRTIFRCCLEFIRHTLKTNFFVLEKQALAFRLDPAYITLLPAEFTSDLPGQLPFRVTFFFGRYGAGYHIGFSDIARGGWRTVITRSPDDYTTNTDKLFKEVYVLAHTQHLKNKDIYEGGSKMVVVVDARDVEEDNQVNHRMYKLQYGFINAFLDIFITRNGRAAHPRVLDYYLQDEPIELGPDEHMHDDMVETIARLSERRGYLLGQGIISSKSFGINHKEYGVTSTGVVKFAQMVMKELGIDIRKDRWSVKMTGGPNGDVAGNAIRILLDTCPGAGIRLILDGSGALYDPRGAHRRELKRLLFKGDIEAFNPARLHEGGFILYRQKRREEGLRKLYMRAERTGTGVRTRWISTDEFHRRLNSLVFEVPADLFIPAGGRPETIHEGNWAQFLAGDGQPSSLAIVEGANSFITPGAREELQRAGVVIMRDASANKCGVISSSYEVSANLLMKE